ncbi:MAG: thrombospondin type 3 repeat-containing protein [bacterium]|nr:thrombospondin type 3 repeat-containing protein [bacterium]
MSLVVAEVPARDALGIRVFKNPDGLSAADWYRDQCKGATKAFLKCGTPTPIVVDGYDGIRDGNTVYVNAANKVINGTTTSNYTNIYLLAVAEGASTGGSAVFDQILANWKFPTTTPKLSDDDAAKLRRDVRRHGELTSLKRFIDSYKATKRCSFTRTQLCSDDTQCSQGEKCGNYLPKLASGTYIPKVSFSTWPSWQQTLGQALGSTLPTDSGRPELLPDPSDPTKKTWQWKHFIGCEAPYDPETCWDARKATMACPLEAYVFAYRYSELNGDPTYTLTTTYEGQSHIPDAWTREIHNPRDWAGTLCTTLPSDSTADPDGDSIPARSDNCPTTYNKDQLDSDRDGVGDLCDLCPRDDKNDADHDGKCANEDSCPSVFNNGRDVNDNGIYDECDTNILYPVQGSAWSPNIGWIVMKTQTAGVSIDVQNNLAGFAWNTNFGWIDMSGARVESSGAVVGTAQGNSLLGTILMNPTRGGVKIQTGKFSGQAWSSQTGWIDFGTVQGNMTTLWKP